MQVMWGSRRFQARDRAHRLRQWRREPARDGKPPTEPTAPPGAHRRTARRIEALTVFYRRVVRAEVLVLRSCLPPLGETLHWFTTDYRLNYLGFRSLGRLHALNLCSLIRA